MVGATGIEPVATPM